MRNEKWFEVFSRLDVWELEIRGQKLRGYLTANQLSDFEPEQIVNNGVSTVFERAKSMGLEFVRVDFHDNEILEDEEKQKRVTVTNATLYKVVNGAERIDKNMGMMKSFEDNLKVILEWFEKNYHEDEKISLEFLRAFQSVMKNE